MKKIIIVTVGILIIVGFIGVNIWQQSETAVVDVQTTQLTEEEISSTVMVPGTLQLAEQQDIYFDTHAGELDQLEVEVGDDVEEGDVLYTLTDEELQMELEQIELTLEANYLQINQLQREEERLKEQKEEMEDDIGEEEAEEQFDHQIEQNETEQRRADIELRQSLLQKEQIEDRIKQLQVMSDFEGTVLEINEEMATSDQQMEAIPFIRLATDALEVEGLITEYDALQVAEGQPVVVQADAIPDEEWEGTVESISYLPQESLSETTNEAVQYPIHIVLEEQDAILRPGLQITVEIETEQRTALTLPLDAVLQDGNDYYVYVLQQGVTERRMIETDMTTLEHIEVTGGVDDEDVVILNVDDVEEGVEVVQHD